MRLHGLDAGNGLLKWSQLDIRNQNDIEDVLPIQRSKCADR